MEYVHLGRDSVPERIVPGASVEFGDELGRVWNSLSTGRPHGSVGFTPTPHLHLQAVAVSTGESLPFRIQGEEMRAGEWYGGGKNIKGDNVELDAIGSKATRREKNTRG